MQCLVFCFSSEESTHSTVLCEDDIPGAKLPHETPRQCSIPQLRHWLACRGITSARLKTKAELVIKVQEVIESEVIYTIVDPTEDKTYIRRKRAGLAATISSPGACQELEHMIPPKHGWCTDLKELPEFNDVTIAQFTESTGKTARSKSCVRPEHRGYQFFSESFVHDYKTCKTDDHYFIQAKCYRSQSKNETPHSIWLALSCNVDITSVLKAFCTCKAGASGYCNHVLAVMHQTAHFYKLECQTVPLRGSKTDHPQVWDKPTRGKKIKAGSVMSESVKRVKLGEGWKTGQKCTLYEAREVVSNNNNLMDEVRDQLKCENANYGFISMASGDDEKTNYVLTRAPICTLVPQGSVLSYQLSTTEANFDTSSIDTSLFCDNLCTS